MAMHRLQLLVTLCLLLAGIASALYPAPKFELNLDLPPNQRWRGAVPAIVKAHGWNNSFGPVIGFYIQQMYGLPTGIPEAIETKIQTQYPENYAELTGIVADFAKYGMTYPMKYWASFIFGYELGHITSWSTLRNSMARACSGILSLPADRSQEILHGRNMDEHPAQGRNMTLHITVTRGGVTLYEVFDWSWVTTGFLTSSRVGGVTLEENWRQTIFPQSANAVLPRIISPTIVPTQFVQRIIQERGLDFHAAVEYLRTVPLGAEAYYIVSGVGRKGAVLSTYPNTSMTHVEFLDDSSPVPFMVQTNYDRWLPDPTEDPRRTVAQNVLTMEGVPRSGTELGIWMALGTWPVHNPTTMYSVLMSPARPLEGYVRNAIQPDGWSPYPYPGYPPV